MPFPGTELFEQLQDKEAILRHIYKGGAFSSHYSIVKLSELNNDEILSLRKQALREFYSPIRILRIALTIRSGQEITYYWHKFRDIILKGRK